MIELKIPGNDNYLLEHAVFDYNGTLAIDGVPEDDVVQLLSELSKLIQIHILTADTFGRVQEELGTYPFNIHILSPGNEKLQKENFVKNLDPESVVAFGNGNNDTEMLKIAALSIAVIGGEGISGKLFQNADIVVRNINEGINLLLHPLRLKATLRN